VKAHEQPKRVHLQRGVPQNEGFTGEIALVVLEVTCYSSAHEAMKVS